MDTYIDERILTLSSLNATQNNGSFLSDVYFNFRGLIKEDTDIQDVKISIQNAQIPNSFYTINVYNNILILDYNSITYTFTITQGNYNSLNIITEITAKFALQGITDITIVTSAITGCMTFTRALSLDFSIMSSGTINQVLGFQPNTTSTSSLGVLTAPFPLNLLGLLKLKIASFEIQTQSYDSSVASNLNILATIPIESGSFGLILYNNFANLQSIINNKTLDGFDLQIYGDDGRLVDFNGINWNISLILAITRVRHQDTKTTFKDLIFPINQLINTLQEQRQPAIEEKVSEDLGQTFTDQTQSDLNDEDNLEVLFYNNRQYL
tara:strand:+ start:643 stop:1614 length:972 start_codon:yes stop_codon:yes gene_type:complete